MRKEYISPEMEIIRYKQTDVIVTSNENNLPLQDVTTNPVEELLDD